MANYNRWQNENLYGTADQLTDEERQCERGAFFGSIQKTLSHLMWAALDEPLLWQTASEGRDSGICVAVFRLGVA
jgi:uncharacterized damage-inducible protein DinB